MKLPPLKLSRKWLIFSVTATGTFMGTLDGGIVNIALPSMAKQFGANIENIQSVDSKHNPYSYLLTIARNLSLNYVKREKLRVSVEPEKVDYVKSDDDLHRDGGLTDFAARVLSEREFRVLMLCAVHKFKRREVGKMLDMPTATVTWTYNKAISKLKKKLEEVLM